MSDKRCRVVLTMVCVVALAGAVDAAAGAVWDQLAILVLVIVLTAGLLLASRSSRQTVTVRSDLGRWLRDRSMTEGESLDALADRSIATYRAHLDSSPLSRR